MSTFDEKIAGMIGSAVEQAIMQNMTGYKSPIPAMVGEAVGRHSGKIKGIVDEAVGELVDTDAFKSELVKAIRAKLAKLLISKFSGQLEKQVNELKQDTTTRARITLAIDTIMEDIVTVKGS